jgi:hypothetical protein
MQASQGAGSAARRRHAGTQHTPAAMLLSERQILLGIS